MAEGTINFKLEGISFEETERLRECIHLLITNGAFHCKNGNVTIHFDNEGVIQEIEIHQKRWKRNKSSSFANPYKNVTIELTK